MSTTTQCAAMYDGGVFYPKHKDCPDCDRCVQMAHGGPSARLTFPAQIVPAATGSEPTVDTVMEAAKAVFRLCKNKTTPENKAYWDHVEKIAAEVRAKVAPTPPASQPTVTQLHGLVESLAFAYRGYLPHEDAPDFSNDTRTRIAFIEDILRKADALLRAAEQK